MPSGRFWTALLPQKAPKPYPVTGLSCDACSAKVQMSVRPVKLESSGNIFATLARVSFITVPTPSKLSSTSGISSTTARSQNDRTTAASEDSTSTAKHSVSELLPAEDSRNSDASATTTAPQNPPPE